MPQFTEKVNKSFLTKFRAMSPTQSPTLVLTLLQLGQEGEQNVNVTTNLTISAGPLVLKQNVKCGLFQQG